MDSVVMTTPSSAAKIRARVRSAFSAVCPRPLRKAQKNNSNRQAVAQRVTQQPTIVVPNKSGLAAVTNRHHSSNSHQRNAVTAINNEASKNIVAKQAAKRTTNNAAAMVASKTSTKTVTVKFVSACPPSSQNDVRHRSHLVTSGIISEALSVWKPRSPNQPVPPDKIQALFNQMQLYPTKRQVQEMLEASRRCASLSSSSRRRNSATNHTSHHSHNSPVTNRSNPISIQERNNDQPASRYAEKHSLTFAEFCVFAAELRRLDKQPMEAIKNKKNSLDCSSFNSRIIRNVQSNHTQMHSTASQTNPDITGLNDTDGKFTSLDNATEEINDRIASEFDCRKENEVFLGGSCNPTTWRTDKAIPALEKLGITYYNPQVSHWTPELIDIEYQAKRCARVMFFVMDDETRSTAGSIEVAQIAAEKRSLVLVLRPYRPGQSILNEKLSPQEFLDLSRNQQMLQELVESRGFPVLSTIESALVRTKQLINHEILSTVYTSGLDVSKTLQDLRSKFDSIDLSGNGYITISQCAAVLIQMGISTFEDEIIDLLSDLNSHTNKSIDDSLTNKNATMTLDFQQFCAVISELNCKRSQMAENDKYNANNFDWVNKQVIHRQSSSNNNTVDNSNLNGTTTNTPYNSKDHEINSINASAEFDVPKRDIYLGGSCMLRTKWRQDIVIPMLEDNGVTYHIPKLHESLAKAYNAFHYTPVFYNETCGLSMSLGSDKSDINHPEKRVKYDDINFSKDGENYKSNNHESTITKANLTINLIDIDRSSSGSSISTVSSLNSPVSVNGESLSYKDFNDTDVLEDFIGPDNGSLYNPSLIENSRVLLFYITNQTRSLAPMTLAAFCIGEGRKVVLCIEMLSENSSICGEKLTKTAIKDFNRGRAYLADMARRENVPVYEDILLATQKAISMIKEE